MTPEMKRARALARKAGWDAQWIRDEQDARAVLDGCSFDAAAADHVVQFFRRFLRHTKRPWQGKPFELLPWQEDFLRRLFGWKRADGTRRYRRAALSIAKKNGKSSLVSGIGLYLLLEGGNVYCAANDRQQAGIVAGEAIAMVRASAPLAKRLSCVESRKCVAYPAGASNLLALSSDASSAEGWNGSVLVDELHAWRARAFWGALLYAGAAQPNAIHLWISTAGVRDETSIGWEEYQRAKAILLGGQPGTEGLRDWSYLSVIYEADASDDLSAPATWRTANPSLGVILSEDVFREEHAAAQSSPSAQADFERYRLNIWRQATSAAIPMADWRANDVHAVHEAALLGRVAHCGLDLGSVGDISAFALTLVCPHDPLAVDVLLRCWIPEAALTDPKNRNRDLYQQLVALGFLRVTPGSATDYSFLKRDILADATKFQIRSLGIDRLFQGQQLAGELIDEGLPVTATGQGFMTMAPLVRAFEERWVARRLHHGNNPILSWMVSHAETVSDAAGNRKFVKPDHAMSSKKIDGLIALVMSFEGLIRQPPPEREMYQAFVLRPGW